MKEIERDEAKDNAKGARFKLFRLASQKMIHQKWWHEETKVKCWEVMMKIGHATHHVKRNIMKKPAEEKELAH